jgi:hypothetical protein
MGENQLDFPSLPPVFPAVGVAGKLGRVSEETRDRVSVVVSGRGSDRGRGRGWSRGWSRGWGRRWGRGPAPGRYWCYWRYRRYRGSG